MRLSLQETILAGAMVLAGCGGEALAPSIPVGPIDGPQASTAVCLTESEIAALIDSVFLDGSPDENSALGKFNNIVLHVSRGESALAQSKTFDLVDFLLKKYRQGTLAVSDPAPLIDLINALFCFAGLDARISTLDAFILFPNDSTVTFVTGDGLAGVQFPATVVSEPTIVTVNQLPFGNGIPSPLQTNLDQYPFFYDFEKFPDLPFILNNGESLLIGICPGPGTADPALQARLVLGHQQDDLNGNGVPDSTEFELLPKANVPFLTCPDPTALAPSTMLGKVLATVAGWFSPPPLHAAVFFAGGVGGTAGEFSPFGPIDPELTVAGGVGGTAGEFSPGAEPLASPGTGCLVGSVEAPVGSPVEEACRPAVIVQTALGTLLSGVPVTFTVENGGGTVAPEAGDLSCGSFGSTATTSSSVFGRAASCWTLGLAPGINTLLAVAGNGGDAIPGTFFAYNGEPTATLIRFSATANPPSQLGFTSQPATGSQVTAGTVIPLAVEVQDKNGVRVQSASHTIDLTLNQFSFSPGSAVSVAAVNGLAAFDPVRIDKAATGYVITAGATLAGTPATVAGNSFDVVPGPWSMISKIAGDGQSVLSGESVPIPPAVLVTDGFGNPTAGAPVHWQTGGSTGSVVSPTQTTTGADGTTAVTSWVLGDGINELLATLDADQPANGPDANDPSVLFTGEGVVDLRVLNACEPGGAKDDLTQFAFWVPGENRSIRSVEVFLSSSGSAKSETPYEVSLIARRGTFDPGAAETWVARATTFLRGDNGSGNPESKRTTFVFDNPILPVPTGKQPPITFEFRVDLNPDGRTLNFNAGPCPPGAKCKVPPGCSVTEVSNTEPFPLGTSFRRSVAVTIKGF